MTADEPLISSTCFNEWHHICKGTVQDAVTPTPCGCTCHLPTDTTHVGSPSAEVTIPPVASAPLTAALAAMNASNAEVGEPPMEVGDAVAYLLPYSESRFTDECFDVITAALTQAGYTIPPR